jgi:hypothetical protein
MTSTESIIPVATAFLSSDFLLAAKDDLLQSGWTRKVAWILGLIVVMGTAWGASSIAGSIRRKGRIRQPSKTPEPKDVFDEICSAHGFSPEEKRQLLDGAVFLNLESPAMLFVDPGLLNQLANSERVDAGEFQMLADRLFPPDVIPPKADLADLT